MDGGVFWTISSWRVRRESWEALCLAFWCGLRRRPQLPGAAIRCALRAGSEATGHFHPDLSGKEGRRHLLGGWAALLHVHSSLGGPATALSSAQSHLHCVEGCLLHSPWQGVARVLSCCLITTGLESTHESHIGTGPKPSLEEITPAWLLSGSVGDMAPSCLKNCLCTKVLSEHIRVG